MNTLQEDYDEMDTPDAQRWVYRMRREQGIHKDEATCWFVDVEQTIDGQFDSDTKWLGRSPGDALVWAFDYARARDAAAGTAWAVGRWK